MITTLNEIVRYYKEFAEAHDQLEGFGYGDTSEISRTDQSKYPLLWMTHATSSNINISNRNQTMDMSITFIVIDQQNIQENSEDAGDFNSDNRQEILSDTLQILNDVVNYTQLNLRNFMLSIPDGSGLSVEWVLDETTDKSYGWALDLILRVPYANCTMPGDFSGVPTSPPSADCDDADVRNSDSSYSNSVASGGTLVLPDIDITLNGSGFLTIPSVQDQDVELVDQDDNPITPDSVVNNKITVTTGGGSCDSLKPTKTGQTISYAANDDGDIEFGRDTDFFTLSWTNHFGNTNRFTDTTGAQTYANSVVIDWTSYDAVLGEVTGYLVSTQSFSTPIQNWNNWMINAPYSDINEEWNDFYVANFNQAASILNWSDNTHLAYPPFNYSLINNNARLWTSTSRGNGGGARAICLQLNQTIGTLLKSESMSALLYKQFTLVELGV
jgi:hypothetical protein